MKKSWLLSSLILVIFLAGLTIRFYRLPSLLNFSQEQAWALSLTAEMFEQKRPALIATPYLSRTTADNLFFYQAATYLYVIAPFYLLFAGDVLAITASFALINIFSGLALFFVARKFFGVATAVFALFLFAFNPVLVGYSRFIWHVPLLIPVVVALIYFTLSHYRRYSTANIPIIGFLLGLGWGIHVSLTVAAAVFFLVFSIQAFRRKPPEGWTSLAPILYLVGFVAGILPLVIFDLRHDFFNFRVLWQFFLGLFSGGNKDSFFFTGYHLVHLIPLACLFLGWLLARLYRRQSRLLVALFMILYLVYAAPGYRLTAISPAGLPLGWNLSGITQASQIIANDATGNFAVAQIIEGETRASNIRYYLNHIYHHPPLPETDYPRADSLYLVANSTQDPVSYEVWEINSIKPVEVAQSWSLPNGYLLYKLVKASP